MSPPARVFETSASLRVSSAEDAIATLRDPSTWPRWQSEILRTEGPAPLEAGDHVLGDARMLGFAVGGRADVRVAEDRTVEHDAIVGIRMRVRYRIEPDGDAWTLTHELAAELPGGLSGRVLSFFLRRRLRRMQSKLIDDLSATLAGSSPDRPVEPRPARAEL